MALFVCYGSMPSTVIAHISYTAATQQLRIVFVSGMVYIYKQVPEAIFKQMKEAFSKGIFFNEHIKGKFDFEKIV